MPFVVWSGAIATAHEKHWTALCSLTCSTFDDSLVRTDEPDGGNSCQHIAAAVSPPSRPSPSQAAPAGIHRAAAPRSHGHDSYREIYLRYSARSPIAGRKACRTWVGAGARPFLEAPCPDMTGGSPACVSACCSPCSAGGKILMFPSMCCLHPPPCSTVSSVHCCHPSEQKVLHCTSGWFHVIHLFPNEKTNVRTINIMQLE